MGKIRVNGYTQEFRGRVGPHVFTRRPDGTMIAGIRPDRSHVVASAAQVGAQAAFVKAVNFAKRVMDNPATRGPYVALADTTKKQNAIAYAVADWFRLPTVDAIKLGNYHGHVGDKIDLEASDDVGVVDVHVVLKDATTHAVLEQGAAVLVAGEDWTYTATTNLSPGQAITIEVTAKDHAGDQTSDTKAYP